MLPLFVLNCTAYYALGEDVSILVLIVTRLTLRCLAQLLQKVQPDPKGVSQMAMLSFDLVSALGIALLVSNKMNWGLEFGPHADDSYFFLNAQVFSETGHVEHSLFDLFNGVLYYTQLRLSGSTPGLLGLLPFTWACAACVMTISWQLACRFCAEPCPRWLVLLALLGNVTFFDIATHLYRDAYVVCFAALSFLGIANCRYKLAVLALLLCGTGRVASALLVLYGISLFYFYNRTRNFAFMTVGACLLFFFLLAGQKLLTRFITSPWTHHEDESISDILEVRYSTFLGAAGDRGVDITASALGMGPVGYPVAAIAGLLAPIRMKPLENEIRAVAIGYSERIIKWSGFEDLVYSATVGLWFLFGPPLLFGLYACLRHKSPIFPIAVYVLVAAVAVSLISMVGRHRAVFIFMFPPVIHYGFQELAHCQYKKLLYFLCAAVLLVANGGWFLSLFG